MPRVTSPAADAILDQHHHVTSPSGAILGFVRLVDYLGGDDRIVAAARVSYGAGTKSVREDAALIDYLLRHGHTSPFEQVVLTFHVRMPIFVARQWLRHRTARVNEISGRYSVISSGAWTPGEDDVAPQATVNKQGRGNAAALNAEVRAEAAQVIEDVNAAASNLYDDLLEAGVAREIARTVLPLGTFTEFYWQMDLHNLFHFLRLRLDEHAQAETRAFASVIADCASVVAPVAFEAFREHALGGVRLGASEWALVRGALRELSERELGGLPAGRRRELIALLGYPQVGDN
jgi:thymidylate synthase (FAD)